MVIGVRAALVSTFRAHDESHIGHRYRAAGVTPALGYLFVIAGQLVCLYCWRCGATVTKFGGSPALPFMNKFIGTPCIVFSAGIAVTTSDDMLWKRENLFEIVSRVSGDNVHDLPPLSIAARQAFQPTAFPCSNALSKSSSISIAAGTDTGAGGAGSAEGDR